MKIKGVILLLFLISQAHQLYPINIKWIKDTHKIFKLEYQHLSPVYGAILWEKSLVEKYDKFGFFGKSIPKDINVGTQKRPIYLSKAPYGTVSLIRELFHEVQGSFNVTYNIASAAYHFSSETIAKICATIEQNKENSSSILIQQLIKVIKADTDLQKSIERFREKYSQLRNEVIKNNPKIKGLREQQSVLKAQLVKEGTPTEKQNIATNLITINNQLSALEQIKKEFGKHNIKTAEGESVNRFVRALVASLQECGFLPTNQLSYPPHTTHSILMAFLYRKAEKKSEYKDYFDELSNALKKEVLTDDGKKLVADPSWITDAFDDSKTSIDNKLARIKSVVEKEQSLDAIKKQLPLDFIAFSEISRPQALPKIAEYSNVKYKGIKFPNCTETTTRNLCNIALFNQKQNNFDLSNYQQPDQLIKDFYGKHQNATTVEEQQVHNDWTNVVENRPFVTYVTIAQHGSKKTANSPDSTEGFIHGLDAKDMKKMPISISFNDGSTDALEQVTINKKKYILINPKQYVAFEVMPSLQNIIILLNQLLGLGLYKNTEQEFVKPEFNKIYFPKLLKKLDWNEKSVPKNLDAPNLQIKLGAGEGTFVLSLSSIKLVHGYVQEVSPIQVGSYQNKIFNLLISNLTKKSSQHLASITCLYARGIIKPDYLLPFPPNSYLVQYSFYLQKLLDPDVVVSMINQLVRQKDPVTLNFVAALLASLPIREDLYYQKQVINKILPHTSESQIKEALDIVVDKILLMEDKVAIINFMISIAHLYPNKAINLAEETIKYESPRAHSLALSLFVELVAKGQAYTEAINAASKGIKDPCTRTMAFNLFIVLVKKGQAYQEAITAVSKGIKDESPTIRWFAQKLKKRLQEKDKWPE